MFAPLAFHEVSTPAEGELFCQSAAVALLSLLSCRAGPRASDCMSYVRAACHIKIPCMSARAKAALERGRARGRGHLRERRGGFLSLYFVFYVAAHLSQVLPSSTRCRRHGVLSFDPPG